MIALNYAHAHKIPLVAVNTCVHELLHALLQDIYGLPKGVSAKLANFESIGMPPPLAVRPGRAIRESAVGLRRLRRKPTAVVDSGPRPATTARSLTVSDDPVAAK
jgi:hypothetical protein